MGGASAYGYLHWAVTSTLELRRFIVELNDGVGITPISRTVRRFVPDPTKTGVRDYVHVAAYSGVQETKSGTYK